jgi:hypothetical protein
VAEIIISWKALLLMAVALFLIITLPFLIVYAVFLLPFPIAILAVVIIVVLWFLRMRKRASTHEEARDELPTA